MGAAATTSITSEEDAEDPNKPSDRAAKKVAKAPNKRAMAVKVSCFTKKSGIDQCCDITKRPSNSSSQITERSNQKDTNQRCQQNVFNDGGSLLTLDRRRAIQARAQKTQFFHLDSFRGGCENNIFVNAVKFSFKLSNTSSKCLLLKNFSLLTNFLLHQHHKSTEAFKPPKSLQNRR
jgi:hypothetical protein